MSSSTVSPDQLTTIVLKNCRLKFQGPQPPVISSTNVSLMFDPVICRIDHGGKPLATLSWEAVTALKLINKPFGLASIFLEISRSSTKGGGLSYLYAEFDNKLAGKLEAALESAITKVVRKQDVPEWLYGNWFKSGFPAAIYSRQLRLAINFTNITVQAALLAWIIVSFVSHLDTAFTAAENRPVPKAVQWFRTLNDPIENWIHTKAWPFVRSHAIVCVPVLMFGAVALFPVLLVGVAIVFGWDIIYHLTVILFHVFQFNSLIRQVYSNVWQVITLVKYTLVWAANFRKKKDIKPKSE